jgi:fructokinase
MDDELDVLAMGELLVHMVATRTGPLGEAPGYTREPGGAAANVATGVARLGRRAAVLGLVGDDPFGRYLIQALAGYGVETGYIGVEPRGRTPVAFVSRAELDQPPDEPGATRDADAAPGAAQFLFYREGGADALWSPAAVREPALARARIVVGSGIALARALPRAALHAAFGRARELGALVAFDVNWWPGLWAQPERARDLYHALLPQVDILKLSAAELILLTGGAATSEQARLDALLHAWVGRLVAGRTRPLLVALTRGPAGCTYGLWQPGGALTPAHLAACDVGVRDRLGAGDAFLAGLLVALLDHLAPMEGQSSVASRQSPVDTSHSAVRTPHSALDLGRLTLDDVAACFAWANASGAAATTRAGAIAGLPARA